MKTREVINRVKKFRDYYGFGISSAPELKTKEDCKRALLRHKRWLEKALWREDELTKALTGVDNFLRELGLEYIGVR